MTAGVPVGTTNITRTKRFSWTSAMRAALCIGCLSSNRNGNAVTNGGKSQYDRVVTILSETAVGCRIG